MSAALGMLGAWLLVGFAGHGCLRAFGRRSYGPEALGLSLLVGATLLAGLAMALSPWHAVNGWSLGLGLLLIGALGWLRSGAKVESHGHTTQSNPHVASASQTLQQTTSSVRSSQPAEGAPHMSQQAKSNRDTLSQTGSFGHALQHVQTKCRALKWLTFVPALLVVGITFVQAFSRPVYNVDAQRRWVLHAQWTAAEGTLVPASVQAESFGASHPSYPPVITALGALALELGADRDWGMRPGFPVFLLALLGVVHGFAWRRAGPLAATLITTVLALTPALSYTDQLGLGAAAAHADIALAAFLTAAATLYLERAENRDSSPMAALCAVALGAVWTKNEGMAFLLVMPVLALVWGWRRPVERRSAIAVLLVAIVGIALWKFQARYMPIAPGEDYVSGGVLAALSAGVERLPTIVRRLFTEFATTDLWGYLWFGWPLAIALGLWRRAGRLFWLANVWLLAGLGLVVAAYVATGWKGDNYTALMDVSLARLIAHHAPLVVVLFALLFAPRPATHE